MKKVGLIVLSFTMTFIFNSCGEGLKNNDNSNTSSESIDKKDDSDKLSFSSAEEAARKYEALMQDYVNALSKGNENRAEVHLKATEDIQSYVNQNFSNQKELIENMGEMSNQMLEMQKDYLDGTFEMYDDLLEGFDFIEESSEVREALDDAKKELDNAMGEAQKEMDDAMKEAQKEMDDAMKEIENQEY